MKMKIFFLSIFLFITACGNEISTEDTAKIYVQLKILKMNIADSAKYEEQKKIVLKKFKTDFNSYTKKLKEIESISDEWDFFFNFAKNYSDTLEKKYNYDPEKPMPIIFN